MKKKAKYRIIKNITWLILIFLCPISFLSAQVPVREEPRHKPVLQNKYFRLLDVWMPPKDTSLFHIHAIPSLFLQLSTTTIGTQIMGKEWVIEKFVTGKSWYRSFLNDTLIHRVANLDNTPLHVTDIEILSSYHNDVSEINPLPFPLLFENERSFAYQLTRREFKNQIISGCGPLIAQLASGETVIYNDILENEKKEIKKGKYLYIPAGATFYFTAHGTKGINLVVFEIK
jgi:hypothetical protein